MTVTLARRRHGDAGPRRRRRGGRPGRRGVHAAPQPGLRVRGRRLRLPRGVGRPRGPRRRRPRRSAAAATDAEASAILGRRRRAAWPSGWPPCASASRRPACCWPRHPGRRRRAAELLDTSDPETAGALRAPTDARSTRGAPACSTSAATEGLVLAVDAVHYVSHWITPELAPRRYDTRFFITAAPPGPGGPPRRRARPSPPSGSDPADALARRGRRRDRAAAADRRQPHEHRRLTSTDEVMAWAARVTDVPDDPAHRPHRGRARC